MDKATIKKVLSSINITEQLNEEEKDFWIKNAKITTLEPPEFIFTENMPREYLYLILEGSVELFKKDAFNNEKRVKVIGKHEIMGEGALIENLPHTLSARVLKKTTLMLVNKDSVSKFYSLYPVTTGRLLMGITRVLSRRVRMNSVKAANIASSYFTGKTRNEHDFLGEKEIPSEYYFGVQTLRALENFYISGISISHVPELIEAMAMIKLAAAKANYDLGLLPKHITDAIVQACKEIISGKLHSNFVVDLMQGGAGTSTNMNANEVIANRALEILEHEKGEYEYCHPNNHVNLSQSTNDVYPSAIKIALINTSSHLMEALYRLISSFRKKGVEFANVIKMGRTQLQDAVPMTLGQEFEAYAVALEAEVERMNMSSKLLLRLNIGGTAIGTGINTYIEYKERAIAYLREISILDVILDSNLIAATQDTGSFVTYSSVLKRLAIKLSRICNDLRLLSSGPRAGINEINLPKMQPGSSIMPGKVNPVIPEVVNQIAYKVIGNDLTVTMASEAGQLELNVMEPVIAQSLFESIEMLKNGMATLKDRCIDGITANKNHCRKLVENSIGIVTTLSPELGYEKCGELAMEALATNKSIKELVIEKNLLPADKVERLLTPENMLQPRAMNSDS